MNDLARRLMERKIVQWGVAYLAAAWLLLQIADVIGPALGFAAGLQRGLLVVLGFGLPLALILAWYRGEKGPQRVSGPELLIVAGVLVIAAATVGIFKQRRDGVAADPPPPARDRQSVAVLPFADMSPGGDQEYFGDGIAEELLSAISQISGLRVAARTSSFALEGSGLDVREIGERLGVASVVEGSVRTSGDRLRIEARLVDVESGFPLWSDRFETRRADIFDVEEAIARDVASALSIRLTGDLGYRLRGQTANPEAQDLYLRGRFEWNRRTRTGLEAAAGHFRQALAIDSSYARAWAGLADAYAALGFHDYRPPAEAFPLAREAAHRALAIEPTLAEPHATLGYAALYHDWDWAEAEREFLRAINQDPEYPVAHQWYGDYLAAMGRFEEAEGEMRTASELDPLSLIAHAAIARVHYYARAPVRAVERLSETLARDSTFELAHLWSGQSYEELGRYEEAAASIERAVELSAGSALTRAALAHVRAGQGRTDEARQILAGLEAEGSSGYVPSYEIARARVALGDHDAAVRWLDRARSERAHSMAFLAVDPQLAPIRGHAGYRRLLEALDLTEVANAVAADEPIPADGS